MDYIGHQSSMTIRAQFEDIDQFGMVHHSVIVKYFERGRSQYLHSIGVSLPEIIEKDISLLVAKLSIRYVKPVALEQIFTVQTTLETVKLSLAIFKQELLDQNGQQMVNGIIHVVSKNALNKPCDMSEIFLK